MMKSKVQCYKMDLFPFQNHTKNLCPSEKMDLDFLCCFRRFEIQNFKIDLNKKKTLSCT